MTAAKGPQREETVCWWCCRVFVYVRISRPKRYCSRECEHARAEVIRSTRRMRRKRITAESSAPQRS